MRRAPGRMRIALAALLQREFPLMGELPLLWRPESIYPARGWWRTSRESACYRWEAAAYFAGRGEHATAMMVGCWNTIGECLQANRLEITGDHPKEVYPLTFAGKLRELSLNQDHTDFTIMSDRMREKHDGP